MTRLLLAPWALMCAVGVAAENDADLPATTPQQIGQHIATSIVEYQTGYLTATFLDSRNTNLFRADAEPIIVRFPGRFLFASDGRRWRAELASMQTRVGERTLTPREWSAGYDGERHYWAEEPDGFVLSELKGLEGIALPEFYWSSHGSGFANSLASGEWELKPTTVVEGYRCYVLHREKQFSYRQRQELIISPRQEYLPVSYRVFQNDKLSMSYELSDLQQTPSGRWFPRRVRKRSPALSQDFDARVTDFEPEREFTADFFAATPPLGVGVRDYREGIVYRNDPWWKELREAVKPSFNWPPPDVSRLDNMGSYSDPAIEGKEAPALTVARWLQFAPDGPINFQGRVTLLHFSGGSLLNPNPGYSVALKAMLEAYEEAGLRIIGIHTHKEDVSDDIRTLRELRLPWPVAVDEQGSESTFGRTFAAYQLRTYSSQVLVDHLGKVHLVQPGQLLKTVQELLAESGAEKLPTFPVDARGMQRDVEREMVRNWQRLRVGALRRAVIRGRVVQDGEGLAEVEIKGQLQLETSSPLTTLGTTIHRGENVATMTQADGRFEIDGLCKGVYKLTFRLAGKAREERRLVLPSSRSVEDLEVTMIPGDKITGRVVDTEGRPVVGAVIRTTYRHYRVRGRRGYQSFRSERVLTGLDGSFEIEDLMSGSYTLEVRHDKIQPQTFEQLEVDSEVTLEVQRNSK